MPPAGPDFVRRAKLMAGDRDGFVETFINATYSLALYNSWFTLDVMVKGAPKPVTFIPGHIWGEDRAFGPVARSDVMIIGKMPGKDELREGRNFVGASGEIFGRALQNVGCGPDEYTSWYVTNVLKFGHPSPQLGNTIATDWLKDCRPLLHQELRLVLPKYILCLGSEAGKELLGQKGTITNSVGKVFDYEIPLPNGEKHIAKLMTCIHPAAIARDSDLLPQLNSSVGLFVRLVRGESIGALETDIEHVVATDEASAVFELQKMIKETENGGAIAIDCEWQGEYPNEPGSWLRTIQVSHKSKYALCIELRKAGGATNLADSPLVYDLLNKLFHRPSIRAVGHFHRADLPWLRHYGLDIRKEFEAPGDAKRGWELTKYEGGFDTGMAAHSVCETDDYKLEVLATRLVGCPRYDMALQDAKKLLCKQLKISADDLPGYGDIPDEVLYPYACYDVDVTRRLFDVYNGVEDKPGLLDYDEYGNNCRMPFWVSMRASPACMEMEDIGLYVDRARANALVDMYRVTMARKVQDLKEMSGWNSFNVNSSFDCRELIFGRSYRRQVNKKTNEALSKAPQEAFLCNLSPVKSTNKNNKKPWEDLEATGEAAQHTPSTDKETLGILFHLTKDEKTAKLVGCLRDVKFIGQLLKTTLKPPAQENGQDMVDEDGERIFEKGLLSYICSDSRIRTHIFQTLETGRYASARPNLQNISKRREADYKRVTGDQYLYPMRSIFVAAPGHVLLEADYVGAELAGMAWMSGDPTMIEHVRRAQLPESDPNYYDIHSAVAVSAFRLNCPATKAGLKSIGMSHLRIAAKNVVFGYAYGRGAAAICRQAKEENVMVTEMEAQALIDGLTRQYPFLPIFFSACRNRTADQMWLCNCYGRFRRFRPTADRKTAGEQERQAMNFPIQSLVADAMSRALDYLYFRRDAYGLNYKIVLQIHDAVLLEVPDAEIEAVHDKVIPECMTSLVPVYPCDLDGIPTAGVGPYYLGTDREVYLQWGEKLKKEECRKRGIPERFGK